ncbi:hypothetical protein [Lysinibacter cavernae]|uniref:hypothetical protein n=1 Tax=Lysinibacter cavernae TaxID=1640652 RepID=UPI00361463FA
MSSNLPDPIDEVILDASWLASDATRIWLEAILSSDQRAGACVPLKMLSDTKRTEIRGDLLFHQYLMPLIVTVSVAIVCALWWLIGSFETAFPMFFKEKLKVEQLQTWVLETYPDIQGGSNFVRTDCLLESNQMCFNDVIRVGGVLTEVQAIQLAGVQALISVETLKELEK